VVRDESNPFFVKTNDFTVKVLGTEFDVKNYDGDTISEITLLSGKIEVHPGKYHTLRKGDDAYLYVVFGVELRIFVTFLL
jgi:ferric-dicitrate binding protein FerR (iron transport regulator)